MSRQQRDASAVCMMFLVRKAVLGTVAAWAQQQYSCLVFVRCFSALQDLLSCERSLIGGIWRTVILVRFVKMSKRMLCSFEEK